MNYYCKRCGSLETSPSVEKIVELEKLCLDCYSMRNAKKKSCKICGDDFFTMSGKQVYCSEECRKESYRRMALDAYHRSKGAA